MLSGDHERLQSEPQSYVKCFYELFKNTAENQRSKNDWKKCKKTRSNKKREKKKLDSSGDLNFPDPPEIELSSNASAFAVFASVRDAILEKNSRITNETYRVSNCNSPQPPDLSDTIDTDSDDEDRISSTQNLPKIVGIGLRSVFTLMRESRTVEPLLCTKALGALLDVLQGQLPEGLKSEPEDVIEPLFDLLLDLATSHGPESTVANDGTHLTAVACACLLSLVVVRGDTGRLLAAIAALLMCPRALATQNIQMPCVLTSLQRSVEAVLVGKITRPDWITYGVPKSSKLYTFNLRLPSDMNNVLLNGRSFVSDGKYLYLHTNRGLLKIGSGYGGTIGGQLYGHKPDFYPTESGWLGYANSSLYFKCAPRKQCELLELDADTLTVRGIAVLEGRDWPSSVMFSDGDNLGMITAGKDEGFVVRTINTLSNPVTVTSELPLKLARKCVDVFGWALFDEEQACHNLSPGCDDEIVSVTAGKEFCILKTISGKLFYTGKGNCLGMKNNTRPNRWLEFTLSKALRVMQVVAGHDGQHVILVIDDGSVLFAGTARRGEDGDGNKIRRILKPVKPKKMLKVEGHCIVDAACNNGSTALVTKEGSLLMFGKDTMHSDPTTGLVTDLKDVFVQRVALGKAHAAIMTNKGHLYTFGINNKGQCGRDFTVVRPVNKEVTVVAMETGTGEDELIIAEDEGGEQVDEWEEARGMCPPGQHQWRHRACMVCTVCRECTGFGISCLSSIIPNRNPKRPGQECGCGVGDSGCSECGCCRICARENCDNSSDMAVFGPSGGGDIGMMRLHMLFEGRSGSNLKDYLKRRLEERKQRQRIKAGPSAVQWSAIKMKGSNNQRPVAPGVVTRKSAPVTFPGSMDSILAEIMAGGSDAERGDATRIASIPPARVPLPSDSPVVQIACGLHHTVVLLHNGEVYSFGSNIYGQLGVGDLIAHAGPVQVKIPASATQIAAGSNHTVILTSKGEVYTFGAYQKGQLGMNWWNGQNEPSSIAIRRSERTQPWHSFPNVVPNIGPRWGRRATWIGAAGDQSYIKVDEINSISLTKSTVMANKNCIILIPHQHEHANSFKCLVINKRDGSCNSFGGNDQVDFSQCATCLDSLYNVIWTFNPVSNELTPYNVITTEARTIPNSKASILSPGLALPVVPTCFVTRTQAAMHLLGCLDTLTQAQDERLIVVEENETSQLVHDKAFSREDFVTVNRFENHGGGWGYSGHSVEAIRFMSDTDILLGGCGLFGGRGEYTAKMKLFDIGIDGGDHENDGELLAETEEIPYECEPRQKYSILFDEPVTLQANRWYVAWARVSGPSSDCGSGGQAMVTAEDQVMFYFKSSKKSNNGTDVNAGQIPQLLYRVIPENQSPNCPRDQPEPVYILRREFSRVVSKNCFQSLISLLQWSWNTLKAGLSTDTTHRLIPSTSYHSVLEMDHLVYISEASLRLLRTYTNEIYPNQVGKKTPQEAVLLAECIGEVRALLRQILSDSIPGSSKTKGKIKSGKTDRVSGNKMIVLILDECHKTFVACYHAFYPTAYLKWTSLCELLSEIDKEQGTSSKDRLLSAVLASLCNSMVRLRCTFPILSNVMDSSDGIKRQLSPSDNAGLPMMNSTEAHQYPILVEQMSYKSQVESIGREVLNWSFRDVLDRLLDLILVPVKKSLCREKNNSLPNLILHCCYLLARVIAELAAQSSGNEDELQAACGRFMYTTPSRFTRMNQTRTWNTGNGSPDAICFSVDRPGIVVAGVAIYGGIGIYNYELELLDDQNNTGNDPSHTQRWSNLDFTRGSFGPDDCVNDIVELKFTKPISIKENVKYAIRLRNHGGRTSNGDGGLNIVRGPDGTNFTFTACSLSFNGTTQTRGQIPHILYYSNPQDADSPHTSKAVAEMQARKCTLAMTTTIVHRANEILSLARERSEDIVAHEVLCNATFVTTLLPLVMGHLGPLATSDPRSGVQVLTLIQEMLPHVAGLNLLSAMGMSQISQDSESQCHNSPPITTSHHYTWLESDHPYKPATVSCYKVTFPESVKWMTVEFTSDCGTAQPEDYLQLYIPNNGASGKSEDSPLYIPVLHKMSNVPSQWPQYAIVLPGNELIFSLETASDYMKDDMSITYGFKCLIIGYDWITSGNGLKNLENELSFLGGACALSLMKKNLILPAVSMEEVEENVKVAQDTAKRIFAEHPSLLGRGFALAAPPTVTQALDGVLPFSGVSNVVNHLDTIAMDHLIQFSFIDMIYAKMATHGVHIHINLAGIIIECQKGAFDVVTTYPLHGTESRMDELFGSRFPRYLMYYDLPFTRDSIDLIYVTTDRSFFAKHGNKASEKRSVGLTWGRIDKYKTRQIYKDIPITPLTIVLSTNTFQAACIGAHEIGHALRITHDPSHVSRCQNQKQCYGIMQKAYPFCFNCLKWSEESLHQFHEFTQLDKDRCFLLNFPRSLYPPGPRRTLSPCQQCHCYGYNSYGEIPDQCSLQVPATSCSKHLQCEGSNEIKSPYEPTILPLDGTPCGQNKVCWDGSCVDIEENQITALCHSNERLFLRDFVVCSAGTSGGRLARWLQPDSFVDPSKCEAIYTREDIKCGWPAMVTILTRDQYSEVVHVPGLKIEVKAVPIDKKDISDVDQGRKIRRVSQPDPMTFGGHPQPALDIPYEVTVNNKMCFYAITIMKAYQNYSFEELRYTSPAVKRSSESMLVRPNGDGSYSATWTPSSVGWYSLMVTIDGYSMENSYKVEVKEPPQGMHPPSQSLIRKPHHQPNRHRKFVAKNSAGLRIRAHPSLQSEQIGIVPVNGTITFIEEIHNDDGVWLRINSETIKGYCNSRHSEAWCLGYNQHLGKTFLSPVDEPKSTIDQVIKENTSRKRGETNDDKKKPTAGLGDWGWIAVNGERTMVVTKAGASGHNIRSRPSLKAAPVGMLALGDMVTIEEYWVNGDGTWVRIDDKSAAKYCFNDDEAWSLAIDKHGTAHMKVNPNETQENDVTEKRIPITVAESITSPINKGFEFSIPSSSHEAFAFSTVNSAPGGGATGGGSGGSADQCDVVNPFIFHSHSQQNSPGSDRFTPEKSEISPKFTKPHSKERVAKEREREGGGSGSGGSKFSALQKWLRGDDKGDKKVRPAGKEKDFSEFVGVSVKELVKAMGESRANGNGATPPETPRRMSRSSSPKNPQGGSPRIHSRSSSPVPIPAGSSRQAPAGSGNCLFPPVANAPVSGGMMDSATSHRRGSTQSDTSALVSSLTRDPSQSPSGISSAANTRDISPSPSCSSLQMRSEESIASPPDTPRKDRDDQATQETLPRRVSQAQTQTSPDSATTAMRAGHFSIGSSGNKDERQSPKVTRRDHTKLVKTRSKRTMSPANIQQQSPNSALNLSKDKVKEAVSPSVAECLRAVFAAFLWHEGIVHDAMACASFLKFHPTLPKNGALVVTRQTIVHSNDKNKDELTREQRARQRHSVEVTNAGNYLHIQPSTLETLTRSAAGANANRNRNKKQDATTIKENEMSSGNNLMSLHETHTVAILPPALKSLVFLWEELSNNCLQAIEQQAILPNPIAHFPIMKTPKKPFPAEKLNNKDDKDKSKDKDIKKGSSKKKKEWNKGPVNSIATTISLMAPATLTTDGNGETETTCELCGQMFPHPVTYHMKTMHPGCGWHSGGMGYNNAGNYCSGWAGNCGDSDFGGTCWYLICDSCRDNYLKSRRNKIWKKLVGGVPRRRGIKNNMLSPINSPNGNDTHIIMKNNAMFLLDLSSASGVTIPKQQRRPSQTLSSVAENYSPPEAAGPFPPTGPFQCLQALGVHHSLSHEEKYYEETLRRQNGQQNNFDGNNSYNTNANGRPLSECPMSDSDSDGGKGRGCGPCGAFHRSVSMSTGAPWARNSNDGRVVMMRKRNNSSSEMNNDGGSSLLCYPSAALQKLVPSMDQSAIVSANNIEIPSSDRIEILIRPVMLFVLQQHNLQHLQLAMKQALRRAACRVYAMQAFNWLLRSVTQPMGLHDLLWWFMASLTPATVELIDGAPADDDNRFDRKDEHDMSGVCEHPLSDLVIAGEAVNPLPTAFHTLLQTIADLMLLPPPGSPLQQAAVQCWSIKFTPADHMFLHRSHVFSNISKILSRSEEEEDITMSMHESHQSVYSQQQITTSVEALKDLTSGVEIKASSRQAMIGHLTDNSTETFWESGDEDRNKTKTISIICGAHTFPRMAYIHIDNCRDLTHKVSSVTFQSGLNVDEMIKLRTVEIESRSAGWINCPIVDTRHVVVGLEFKGPDNSLRVRQIRILGEIEGESLKIGKQLSTMTIQQRNCEAETLKVFRFITSQVFGKLIQGDNNKQQNDNHNHNHNLQEAAVEAVGNEELEDSHDLREHMVGILFSRSKLTHLQKQVCTHIVQAIRKETIRLREEWEALLCSPMPATNSVLSDSSDLPKASDTYCFEMLSMVLALSGSSVGRNYLSHQYGLIKDILSLLHTGSARVQRQVTSLLRRILPHIKPESFANVLGVNRLPPSDFSIVSTANGGQAQANDFDEHDAGILDVFLSCIAKTLSVQVKVKGKENNGKALQTVSLATSIHPKSFVGSRWWLRGCMARKLSEVIIQLLKDMASGKLSDTWAQITKSAIAENILNLTRLDEKRREPGECLRTPTLWLALSSLCVLDSDHVERLSSGQWSAMDGGQPPPPRPTCTNHDDGETTAIIRCNVCANLCADCDRVLHLHRRTRMHVRQVCKEEEEAIRVDLHEGCGRTKLFWILALADSRTLKALVEFRDGTSREPVGTTGVCRFCGATGNTGLLAISNICSDHDCQEHAKSACSKTHTCGHICGGVRNEKQCLPCLHRCQSTNDLKQDADDMCMICFTEALSCAPAIQLQCGHVFHLHCCRNVLMKRWVGPRITFGFSLCPICKVSIEHPTLTEHLTSIKELFADVKRKALMRLEYEGLHKADAVTTPGGRYYKDPASYAMDRYAYYVCYKCQKAYYGGEARCDAQLGGESFDPTELVCGGCSDVARAQMCPKHGADFLEYKCRYCCSTAVFFCFGTTHFCNPCHDDFQRVTNIPKSELPSCPAGPRAKQLDGEECPLHVKHPPTGEEFALGCGICRNAHTF